jgi:hypothetical protein
MATDDSDVTLALGKARELEAWLRALADRLEYCSPEEYEAVAQAADDMDIVIGDLEPEPEIDDDEDEDPLQPQPRLRIVGRLS